MPRQASGRPWRAATLGILLAIPINGHWMTTAFTRDLCLWASMAGRPLRESSTVIVTVGDDDLAHYRSREPQYLDRAIYAKAVSALDRLGARTVLFDVLFDRQAPAGQESDRLMAAALKRFGRVYLPGCFNTMEGSSAVKWVGPVPELMAAAAGTGFVNVNADVDDVIRRVGLVAQVEGTLHRHIVLATACHGDSGVGVELVEEGIKASLGPVADKKLIPTRTDGTVVVNVATVPEIPRVALRELLEPGDLEGLHRTLFQDKTVLIGSVSPMLRDRHAYTRRWLTGERTLEDGVWVLALFHENLINGQFLFDVGDRHPWIAPLGMLTAGLLFLASTARGSFGILMLLSLGVWLLAAALHAKGTLLDAAGLCAGLTAVWSAQATGRWWIERSRIQGLNVELQKEVEIYRRSMQSPGGEPLPAGPLMPLTPSGHPVPAFTPSGSPVVVGPSGIGAEFLKHYLPGRYQVTDILGQGGMGVVFRAQDLMLGHPVAVKVLSPLTSNDPAATRRFLQEARTLKRLNHPGLVKVHDVREEVLAFFTMDLVEGTLLRSVVGSGKALELPKALGLCHSLASVLAYVHGQDILHRDLKPDNVMVVSGNTVKLLDFGLARVTDATRITVSGAMMGTLMYMAPEMLSGRPVTAASDVYTLAVMTIEMICGQLPERQGTTHTFNRGSLVNRGASDRLISLLERCMAEDGRNRPQDAKAMLVDLDRLR